MNVLIDVLHYNCYTLLPFLFDCFFKKLAIKNYQVKTVINMYICLIGFVFQLM